MYIFHSCWMQITFHYGRRMEHNSSSCLRRVTEIAIIRGIFHLVRRDFENEAKTKTGCHFENPGDPGDEVVVSSCSSRVLRNVVDNKIRRS